MVLQEWPSAFLKKVDSLKHAILFELQEIILKALLAIEQISAYSKKLKFV